MSPTGTTTGAANRRRATLIGGTAALRQRQAVGGFCGATAILAMLCHAGFEQTVWPDTIGWLAILGLGPGPVGLAFFV